MKQITDEKLIEELKNRIEDNKKPYAEINKLMGQLKEVNQKLAESEKMKSHFLSNIRNEINNPIASILGLSASIQSLTPSDWNKVQSLAKYLHQESFNLDFQLKNIFAAAEIEAGECSPEIAHVNIVQVIKGLISSYEHKLKSLNIEISFVYNEDSIDRIGYFQTDPQKLQLIISNLINNAIEFSAKGSKVAIKVWTDDNNLRISVQDFGVGISKNDITSIYDRFKQLDTGIVKEYRGHGLGLSVTKSMLEVINGSIVIESQEGQGSIFTISIHELQIALGPGNFSSEGNEIFFDETENF